MCKGDEKSPSSSVSQVVLWMYLGGIQVLMMAKCSKQNDSELQLVLGALKQPHIKTVNTL